MAGVQKRLPRWARMCPLCFQEVEDAKHVLFRCPTYGKMRVQFLLGAGLTGAIGQAAQEVASGSGREDELCEWMMSAEGEQLGMGYLEQLMQERAQVLG